MVELPHLIQKGLTQISLLVEPWSPQELVLVVDHGVDLGGFNHISSIQVLNSWKLGIL
jgi:hypothetical protein